MFHTTFRKMLEGLVMYWLQNRESNGSGRYYIYEKDFSIRPGALMKKGTSVSVEISIENDPRRE